MENEYVVELFEMAEKGEISYRELNMELETGGFDGDLIDFL
jgi:hypothetical protein